MSLNDAAQLHTPGAHNNVRDAVPVVIQRPDNVSFWILRHVGSGTYGHVFLAKCRECGFQGALKIVPAVASEDTELPHTADRHVFREVTFHTFLRKILTETNSQHVVRAISGWRMEGVTKQKYLDWYKQNIKTLVPKPDSATRRLKDGLPENMLLNMYFILMPYFEMGNLKTWLIKDLTFSKEVYEQRLSLFRDILSGVEFMHTKDLIHRRLCPDNILLKDDGHARIRAVIGGLGRITSYGENPEWPLSKNQNNVMSRRIETIGADPEAFRELFEAPEVKGTDYDKGCDYYSIGVIALQLFLNLRTRNDIVDAILCLQSDGTIGAKQDNAALPKKKFWLDIVRKQVSRKREQRYSCSDLLQLLREGLGDHEMQNVECEGDGPQTGESTSDESFASCNIASQDDYRSVSSASTPSLPSELAPVQPLSRDECTKLAPSQSTPSLSTLRTSQSFLHVGNRNLSFNDLQAILKTPGVRYALLDHLDVGHFSLYMSNLCPQTRQITSVQSMISVQEKVNKFLEYVMRDEKAIREFFNLLAKRQPDLNNTVMMEGQVCDSPALQSQK